MLVRIKDNTTYIYTRGPWKDRGNEEGRVERTRVETTPWLVGSFDADLIPSPHLLPIIIILPTLSSIYPLHYNSYPLLTIYFTTTTTAIFKYIYIRTYNSASHSFTRINTILYLQAIEPHLIFYSFSRLPVDLLRSSDTLESHLSCTLSFFFLPLSFSEITPNNSRASHSFPL